MFAKRFLAVLAAALCLCACAPAIGGQPTPLAMLPPVERPAQQSLVFLVDSGATAIVNEAAELFRKQVGELSGGMLTIELQRSITPAADYLSGKGQIVFLDGRRNESACPDFSFLSRPLRYPDYKTFTMALNSRRMLEAVNDEMDTTGFRLLAAYYQGGGRLVSAKPLTGGDLTRQPVDEDQEDGEEVWAPPAAALCADTALTGLMEEFGAEVRRVQSANDRLYELTSGGVDVAEFTLDEIHRLDWQDTQLNLINLDYTMVPLWLAVDREAYANLPAQYQAILQEASAYLFPAIDGRCRAQEDEAVLFLQQQGLTVDRSFSALRKTAESRDEAEAEDPRAKYLLSLLTGMQ